MAAEPPPTVHYNSAGRRAVKEREKMIQTSLETPRARFLKAHLEKAGCAVGNNFIKAVNCDGKVSGAYRRGDWIYVCRNHKAFQDYVNQMVVHGLINAYDDCRAANLDSSNCANHACTEVT